VYTQPLKMELIQGSETSANYNLTPGKYPKENIQSTLFFGTPQTVFLYTNIIPVRVSFLGLI